MLLVSPEYFDRLRRHNDDDLDTEARNEKSHVRNLLKKNAHPYDTWVNLREVQDPLLRRAQKKRRPVTLPIYETVASGSRHVDTGIQTYESDRSADVDDDNGDYVTPEDEEIARYGETHFGRIATRYLKQYVRIGLSLFAI
jgi:hypothetical protein